MLSIAANISERRGSRLHALRHGISRTLRTLPPAARVALSGVLASALVAVGLGVFINTEIRERLLAAEARGLETAVAAIHDSMPDLGTPPLTVDQVAVMDELVDGAILDADHVRVKLWTLDGRVIYSDARDLIGRRYDDVLPRLAQVARSGSMTEVTDLLDPENELESGYAQLVEFYIPVRDASGQTVAVFEIYGDVSFLEQALGRISTATWLAIGTGLSILLAFLVTLIATTVNAVTHDRTAAEARAAELEVLVRASNALRSSLEPAELLERLQEGIRQALDLDAVWVASAAPSTPDTVGVRLRDDTWLVAERRTRPPSADDRRILESIAGSLDAALANAALYAEVRQAADERRQLLRRVVQAHEDERGRIVGELHDTLAGELIRILYGIRGMAARLEGMPDDVVRELAVVDRLTADAEEHLRAFMGRVRPVEIETIGLRAALEQTVGSFREETNLRVRLTVHDDLATITNDLGSVILRAAEEALLNVRKHATASAVVVRLAVRGSDAILSVDDDGVGWQAAAGSYVNGRGLGLPYLRERVAAFRGSIRLELSRLGGARLVVRLPGGKAT